ncbi:MAG: glutamate-5-semialdehyde dehydrogenase [Chitinophagaceae bacterium]
MDHTSDFIKAREAARQLVLLDEEKINAVLLSLADLLIQSSAALVSANEKDLSRMDKAAPNYDRLLLNTARIAAIAADLRNVAALPSPLNKLREARTLPNGLYLEKRSVPLGVVGVIYEARPNVTVDVFSLCFKTGNVCMLKGGSDASFSNEALVALIHEVLDQYSIDRSAAVLLPPDRSAATALLEAREYVDVLIPRGSQGLINHVRTHSKVPVIETGAGIVHTYFDASGDLEKGKAIIANSKTRRVSVCNALDCLLVHESRLGDLPLLLAPLGAKNVRLFADEAAFSVLKEHYPEQLLSPAGPGHFGTEFLSLQMAVKTVNGLNEALDHIATFSSKHSEAIISEHKTNQQRFLKEVDAAAVYVNASTAFTDGAQFGLGAEIGISTQKLHARGPMGLEELTSYKWLVTGDGQTRP